MRILLCVCFLFILVLPALAQNGFRLEGKITDENTGSPLPGATIQGKNRRQNGTAADKNGEFSLLLPAGKHTLVCMIVGYEAREIEVEMDGDRSIRIKMKETAMNIEEVVVTSRSAMDRISNVQIGVERIEMAEMARVPSLFGERDIMRSLQLLPGIKSESDGSSGFQVRGGTAAQNLILLDDATIYNAGHLMGIFSTFNDDALATASLYKGQIPAQFGGATSSVFDVATKSGDMQKYRVNGTVGLLSAKLNVEGPIVKDKASFFLSGRRSYLDLFLKLTDEYKNNVMNFYDINAKVNYAIDADNMLSVSFFSGRDNMGLQDLMEMQWGNTAYTARWFHRFNSRWHSNTSVVYSGYKTDNGIDILGIDERFGGFIRQGGLKQGFVWSDGRRTLNMGVRSFLLRLQSAEWEYSNLHEEEVRTAWENTAWINADWKLSDRLELSAGLRFNAFSALGGSPYYELDDEGNILDTHDYKSGRFVKTHFAPEPRLSLNYRLSERQSLKAGYSRTSQNIHAIRNSSSSMPFDRYTMSSNLVRPQTADQVSIGYVALSPDQQYEFSVEGYYKTIDHIYDYKDGKSFSSEIEIERLILGGEGRAYGAEFFVRKNTGRLTGWIGYTLSWSENKIPGINGGRWYTAGNDRRHDVSVVAMYDLSKNWHMSAAWVYNTGQALTAPSGKYELDGETVYYYAERNGYRSPDYHRLDISFTHTKQKKRYVRQWSFGLYNVYNRYNPYIISFENDESKPSGSKTMQYSLFGIVPSVAYTFKF